MPFHMGPAPIAANPDGQEESDAEFEPEHAPEAQVPLARRAVPKEPTAPERQEHEDSGHVMYRSWCKACRSARSSGSQHRSRDVDPDEEAQQDPVVAFD